MLRNLVAIGVSCMLFAVLACGSTKSDSTSGDDGGACPNGDVVRLGNGECSAAVEFGVDDDHPDCCRHCSKSEGVDTSSGVPRCVVPADGGIPPIDAGSDAAAACPTYGSSDKQCATASDCTTVARGCYCGAQPVIGISKSVAAAADACETSAAMNCALGCANFPGHVAEDGKSDVDGGTITVLCDAMQCHTVVQ